jgi:nitroreductase
MLFRHMHPGLELLTTTRAVRRRLDLTRPVPRELLLRCVDVAQQAPTAGNSQGWRFVLVDDPDQRRRLAAIYQDAGLGLLEEGLASATDDQTRRVYESAIHLAHSLDRVPVHVVPLVVGRPDSWGPEFVAGVYANILPATWSFMLAARALGLGTCWTTSTLARQDDVAEVLGLPEDVTQVGLIPTAYYTGSSFSPARRPPAERIVSWDRWSDDPQ